MSEVSFALGTTIVPPRPLEKSMDGGLALEGNKVAGELNLSTNFQELSLEGAASKMFGDYVEGGLVLGTVLFSGSPNTFGSLGIAFPFSLGRFGLTPEGSLDLSYTKGETLPPESSSDYAGMFSNDQGIGGVENRPFIETHPGGIQTSSSGGSMGITLGLTVEKSLVGPVALEIGGTVGWSLYPEIEKTSEMDAALIFSF